MTAASALGFFTAHGYFAGRAAVVGVPFGFTWLADGYVEVFLFSALTAVIALAFAIPTATAGKLVDNNPTAERVFMIGFPILMISGIVLVATVPSFRRWLIDLYEPLLPVMISVLVTWAAAFLCLRVFKGRLATLLGICLMLLAFYFLMTCVGGQVERSRTSWTVASMQNDHFAVVGHRGDRLLVAPLISTAPPTYVKEFRYLDINTPDLRLQKVWFDGMVRQEGAGVTVAEP